ncbi:unnamed protein product [Trichobilharzia regenti]|nr:unnamed protein product [Trichobilharzia regenti]
MENEHLNNCGQFRAVRDIFITPLPKRPPRTSSLTTFENPNSHNSGISKFIRSNLTSKNAVQLLAYSPVAGRRSVPDLLGEKTFDPSHKTSHFQACDGLVNQRRIGVVESEYEPSPTLKMPSENEEILPDTMYKNPIHRIWKQLKSLGKESTKNVKQCNYEMSSVECTNNLCPNKPTFTLFIDSEDVHHTPEHSPALFCSGERNFSSSQRSPDIVINQPKLNLSGVSKPRVFVRDKRVLILDRQTDKEWGEPYEKCKLDVSSNEYYILCQF